MKYFSTRNLNQEGVSAAQAIKQGLCNDGGLFMPETIPALSLDDIVAMCDELIEEHAKSGFPVL